ncbi:hypothetical protein NW752_001368 [Fusarium irregulare]|uniref:Uncharacterized protein n=1 Tax=Fusarium irregulare TaxID=2494466 RepID=A0A9W8U6D0_9HYPO|nr:hypothetical protein NW766_010947 [Fusarium irregulare]KAJ4026425.1 hypothetical protein NW752_001368 [Fusarium irregulare]
MENNALAPSQPSRVTSQLRVNGEDGAIDDLHSPLIQTATPRAGYRTHNPTISRMLPQAYLYLAWVELISTLLFLCIALVAYVCLVNSLVESFARAFVFYLLIIYTLLALPVASMLIKSMYGCDDFVYREQQQKGLWWTGVLPTGSPVCNQRLEEKQHILLDKEYYGAQFDRVVIRNASIFVPLEFNQTWFLEIDNNADICYQGFEGNQDLYGLGVRGCIYLQWIAALITNNFLPATRQVSRGAWLTFSTAMCILAFVASTADYCVFSIEMEILYWLYWGGFVCVYASAPSQTEPLEQARCVGLDWNSMIRYTLHILMACHGLWYSFCGYDQVFARMPCGTYHFMFAKLLDPSNAYSYTRDVLSAVFSIIGTLLLAGIPVAIVFIAAELKAPIKHSTVYRMLFRSGTRQSLEEEWQRLTGSNERISNGNGRERHAASLLLRMRDAFFGEALAMNDYVRHLVGLPEPRQGGLRLLTHEDVRQRRWVTACHLHMLCHSSS